MAFLARLRFVFSKRKQLTVEVWVDDWMLDLIEEGERTGDPTVDLLVDLRRVLDEDL
jgi:hypothetical protein